MKKIRFLNLIIILSAAFAISGINFDDLSFKENSKEYVLLTIAFLLIIVYIVNRIRQFPNK